MVSAYEGKDHVLCSADREACLSVWKLEDGVCLRTSNECLSWVPQSMKTVSCKGKTLIAACGPSPDIEVYDVVQMKRIVRLFGHGDWVCDICTRNSDLMAEQLVQSPSEPSLYSLDRGGTVCVWLADRSCSTNVVGWIPSVQVHRTPVSLPSSLAVDSLCSSLIVVGASTCARYMLGKDHRFAEKNAKPTVVQLDLSGATESSTRQVVYAQSISKCAEAFFLQNEFLSEMMNRQKMRGWFDSRVALSPRGDRAVIWKPGVGFTLVRFSDHVPSESEVSLSSVSVPLREQAFYDVSAFGADDGGWMCLAKFDSSGKSELLVLSPDESKFAPPPPATMSLAAALRQRHANAQAEGDNNNAEQGNEDSVLVPEVQPKQEDGEGKNGCVAEGWEEMFRGVLSSAFYEPRGASGDCTCSLFHVEGARNLHSLTHDTEPPWFDPRGRRTVRPNRPRNRMHKTEMFWALGYTRGDILIFNVPTGSVAHSLCGHKAAVLSMMWISGESLLVSGSQDGCVMLWDLDKGVLKGSLQQHVGPVTRIVELGTGADSYLRHAFTFCTLSLDHTVGIIAPPAELPADQVEKSKSPSSCKLLFRLIGHSSPVVDVRWAPRHSYLYAVCEEGDMLVWEMQAGSARCIRRVSSLEVPTMLNALARPSRGSPIIHDDMDKSSKSSQEAEKKAGEVKKPDAQQESWLEDHDQVHFVAPIEARSLQLHHAGATGRDSVDFLGVLLLRCDAIALSLQQLQESGSERRKEVSDSPAGVMRRSISENSFDVEETSVRSPSLSSKAGRAGQLQEDRELEQQGRTSVPSPVSSEASSSQRSDASTPRKMVWELMGSDHSLLASATAIAMTNFTPSSVAPHREILSSSSSSSSSWSQRSNSSLSCRVSGALRSLGFPSMMEEIAEASSPQHAQRPAGSQPPPSLQCSYVMVGAGQSVTCYSPRLSSDCLICGVSPQVSETATMSAAVLIDACRSNSQQSGAGGVEIFSALLHFLAKEMAPRLQRFIEPDVIALAHYWLSASEPARQAIVREWTSKLPPPSSNESLRPEIGIARSAKLPSSPGGVQQLGFSPSDGPAIVVLAVIGAHFQESLDDTTAARVTDGLIRALSSSNLLHAKVASHLLARGAQLWCRHIRDGESLLRILYARYWKHQDFKISLADAELALRQPRHSRRSYEDSPKPLFISAVAFDAAGQRLATFSLQEGRIRYWEVRDEEEDEDEDEDEEEWEGGGGQGNSGPFGLFSNKVSRCVQQFNVPPVFTQESSEKGEVLTMAFRVLFTPNAIVLTRDSVPLCEFSISK
ncbi:hypothetical protein GUITHDRAFT_106293 [Guillardia theta CCMP2712]|uniref:Uncharacterized protein n=1 Tax=Guillardia theta (strain CCMP2712) TaxID=905079 RepID=L1JGW0_GUITC|nr:hypothetical protein GUITHDRAFT_106293 [Guillardia theta CCMP2712]EKX47741.1 hypothetical protein GUITHDRAFT_106293 [Guillardia theta CCMP2712]|eukprot:XP_005834721.1 hypothetical protein GUITHDRAFT_106293 [Guillardia theta CCMP2712]